MAGIESELTATFLAQLERAEDVPNVVTERLKALLDADKLPNSDQLATLYAEASGESLL